MDKELRKRLEEAENNHVGYSFSPNERPEISSTRTAFYAGALQGYKEAIALAKEWLKEKYHLFDHFDKDEVIADFEADMNKLWEDKGNA